MAFLERNLEQLTIVQRQLVEQNGNLKKEVAIAERKLIARNERIGSLEGLLGDSQDKLAAACNMPANGHGGMLGAHIFHGLWGKTKWRCGSLKRRGTGGKDARGY